jgi:hypothetical protein
LPSKVKDNLRLGTEIGEIGHPAEGKGVADRSEMPELTMHAAEDVRRAVVRGDVLSGVSSNICRFRLDENYFDT